MIKKICVVIFSLFLIVMFSNGIVAYAYSGEEIIDENNLELVGEENEEIIQYTVTYDLNGGTYNGLSSYSEMYDENSLLVELDESLLERVNCTFVSWETMDGFSWNFEEDVITSDITLIAIWDWDETLPIYTLNAKYHYWDVEEYLLNKYHGNTYSGDTYVYKKYTNSVKSVTGAYPIEMQSSDFTRTEILQALSRTTSNSTYGGCGPIAMMGIMHYFSATLGYSEIINNPKDSVQRIELAYDVLSNTPTTEVGFVGDKGTFTWPSDFESSFNQLMYSYGLNGKISATNHGVWKSKEYNIEKAKESIDNGIPVTLFTALAGSSDVGSHYVNLFGYEDWYIEDKNGEIITNTVFMMRMNWDWSSLDSYIAYVDADILCNNFTGIITYQISGYDNSTIIYASDFAEEFINTSTGQGQYFFDPRETLVTTTSGYTFNTKRLRCSYIENQYLVLSANRLNAGTAYLEFNLPNNIRKMTFDMALWSGTEYLGSGGTLSIQIYQEKEGSEGEYEWKDHIVFDIYSLSVLRDYPKNYTVYFPANTSKFRFYVTKENPTGDRNKGRVVLDNIVFYYDEEDN